jgi:quinol monooxygenase YgiN
MPAKRKKKPARSPRARPAPLRLTPDAMVLIVQFRAREGQEGVLEQELRALVPATRREEGCLTYELHRSASTPGHFMLVEIWASRDHHTRHLETPHMQRWAACKDAFLASREASFWKHVS